MLPGNPKIRRDDALRGHTAKADNDFGFQQKRFVF